MDENKEIQKEEKKANFKYVKNVSWSAVKIILRSTGSPLTA